MRHSLSILALALALSACDKGGAPDGQVIAKVNGEEITRTQLNAALPQDMGSNNNKNAAQIRNSVLDQLVMQQLVVQEAKRQGLDKSQEYLILSRRANDQILSDMLSRRVLRNLRVPYAQNVDKFIEDNPSRFANRQIITVDQIRFPSVASFDVNSLRDAHTMEDVAGRLQRARVQMERGRASIDSAVVAPAELNRILALPAGEPFVVREGGLTLVSTIIDRRPAPIPPQQANGVALNILKQQAARDALTRQLELLRKGAQIEYQAGFAAPARVPSRAAQPVAAAGS